MDKRLVEESFKESKDILDTIIGYKTNCFRACGYCLETYSDYINLFKANGITKDSSVARQLYTDTPVHTYDYRDIPVEQLYYFRDSIRKKDELGSFKELSISSFRMPSYVYYYYTFLLSRKYNSGHIYGDGKPLPDGKAHRLKFRYFFNSKELLASLDGKRSIFLPYYLNKAEKQKQKELVICGHPKNATEGSIKNLEKFLAMTSGRHEFLTSRNI